MSWPPTKEEWDSLLERMSNPPPREPYVRYVSPKMYDVLKSMYDEGLITGEPFSEMASAETLDEFHRRMEAGA